MSMTRGEHPRGIGTDADETLPYGAGQDPTTAPSANDTDDDARDDRVVAAVRAYSDELDAGRRPDRREFIARYPDIAQELSACLAGLNFVRSAAAGIAGGADAQPAAGVAMGGEPLGDFRLVREIGRGGMGVVYEAMQMSLGRRVAVKVLPLASALDARHIQRFRNEAQAAAQLHHTSIVPVYAVGFERSVHFYAMQLIEGASLAEVIRALRQVPPPATRAPRGSSSTPAARPHARDTRQPPTASGTRSNAVSAQPSAPSATASASSITIRGNSRSRAVLAGDPSDAAVANLTALRGARGVGYYHAVAKLGEQAADALDYAHRAGVVHRDIKPGNLMLDAHGNLWITDFGLAQIYSDDRITRSGDMVGTLRYMSPEQASGRAVVLDQRTDVYSLGVTLYELLTLEPALSGETREQLLRQIDAHDPRPARAVDRAIPRELETILIKATAKDPADRYPSAGAMAEDLRRFLCDEPIRARPPTLWDQAVKWTRRHRPIVASAFIILVLASVGLLVSTVRIARERTKTEAAYLRESARAAEAAQQHARADAHLAAAREAVNFLARVAAEELADTPESAEVRHEMLSAALDYYQGIADAQPAGAAVTAELAEAQAYVTRLLSEESAFADMHRADVGLHLLRDATVQSALGLSAAQIEAAAKITPVFEGQSERNDAPHREGQRAGFGSDRGPRDRAGGPDGAGERPWARNGEPPEFRGLTAEQKHKRFADAATRIGTALSGILTPPQSARLDQISRQTREPTSFDDPEAVAALSLSREQKEAVRRAQAAFRVNARKLLTPPPPPQRGDGGGGGGAWPRRSHVARFASIRAEAVQQILRQLSPAQATAWDRLLGDTFPQAVALGADVFGAHLPADGNGPPGQDRPNRGAPAPGDDPNDDGFGPGGPPLIPGNDRPPEHPPAPPERFDGAGDPFPEPGPRRGPGRRGSPGGGQDGPEVGPP